ncbi:MAG: arylsulfatase [Saprospiraceae bacterium]|nr:arylsulfatase [Saprospiraceae bacterium]
MLLLGLGSCTQKIPKPNIIIIYADDLGYGDVQAYNPVRGKIPTPHIDRLATEGMRFTDAHSSSAVCTPSRYTLLTGRYHWRSRLQKGIVGVFRAPLIVPNRLTIGGLAKQRGYQTACVGKWHLGWNWPISQEKRALFTSRDKNVRATEAHRRAWQEVFSQPIAGGPTAVGFDKYFGTDVPNWPPFCFIENDHTVGIPIEFGSGKLFGKNQASLQGPSLKDWALEDVLPALEDRSVDFINRMAESPDPFLLYLPLTSPHTPLSVNREWRGKSGLSLYGDLVMETDAVVGRVLHILEKTGEADNTIIIFTSDNGCAPYIGNTTAAEALDTSFKSWPWDRKRHQDMPIAALEAKGHYPSGPLRGYKSDVWEGGHRIPFIVRWPGVVAPGRSSAQLVHQADILATIAEILDVSLPPDAGEDSYSLLPLLKGEDGPVREHAVSASIHGLPSVRLGAWKLILAQGSGGWSPGGDSSRIQLYNLAEDLGETQNIADEQPGRVSEMKALMEKLISDGRSTPGPKQENDVEVIRYTD